jgi:phospholipase/lecithinase/hemolysin
MKMLSSAQFSSENYKIFLYIGFNEVAEGVRNAAIFIKNHPACPSVHDYIFWDNLHPEEIHSLQAHK